MSSNLDNEVMSMFAAATTTYSEAQANSGDGAQGPWPSPGDHLCSVDGMVVKRDVQKEKTSGNGDQLEIPFISVQFSYTVKEPEDPTKTDEVDMRFTGEVFRLFTDADAKKLPTDGKRTASRIQWERFKNHCEQLLGSPGQPATANTNPAKDIEAINTLLASTSVLAKIRCVYREGKAKGANQKAPIYKTEYVRERVA